MQQISANIYTVKVLFTNDSLGLNHKTGISDGIAVFAEMQIAEHLSADSKGQLTTTHNTTKKTRRILFVEHIE